MHKHQHQNTRITKNQGHITEPKETDKASLMESKEMDIYELPNERIQNEGLEDL